MSLAPPLRVVFMGTPKFAVPTLQAIANNPDVAKILAVYTQPDRPAGRGQRLTPPPVKETALELGFSVFQPESVNTSDEQRKLADLMADVVVVVAFAQFLGKGVLNIPRLGCVNVHSSLLPKYRGAAPIQYAILNGDRETGVTTMRLVSKMDAGPMLLQASLPIPADMGAQELHDKLSVLGAGLLVETLRGLRDSTLKETPQDESQVSFAPLIKKEMGFIDWNKTAYQILCQIRAFEMWPGTFVKTSRGILKIHKARLCQVLGGVPVNSAPGHVFMGAGGLFVKCVDYWLELVVVQPEGKKSMAASEYLNGLQGKPPLV